MPPFFLLRHGSYPGHWDHLHQKRETTDSLSEGGLVAVGRPVAGQGWQPVVGGGGGGQGCQPATVRLAPRVTDYHPPYQGS